MDIFLIYLNKSRKYGIKIENRAKIWNTHNFYLKYLVLI